MVKKKEKKLDYSKNTCCLPEILCHCHFTFLFHIHMCFLLHKYALSILLGLILDKGRSLQEGSIFNYLLFYL